MRQALVKITNSIVENVIVTGNDFILNIPNIELIQLEENEACGPGWQYKPNEIPRFIQPYIELVNRWTAYEFLLRFTAEERAAIRESAKTDPNTADFLQLAQAAQEIISNDPITLQGMNYIVSIGIISENRKNEILGLNI
jgi:hypothetical protein